MKNLKSYVAEKTVQGLLPNLPLRAGLSQNSMDKIGACIKHDYNCVVLDNRQHLRLLRVIREVELYCIRFELDRPEFD